MILNALDPEWVETESADQFFEIFLLNFLKDKNRLEGEKSWNFWDKKYRFKFEFLGNKKSLKIKLIFIQNLFQNK